jgi:WD40 repeat protein
MARLWNAATGKAIGSPMRQRNTVTTVAFSPDSRRIVTGNDGGVVQQWDLVRGRHIGKTVETEGRLCGAVFNQGDLWILTQVNGMVQFKNATTGELIGKPFSGPETLRFTALSPDGSILITQKGGYAPELYMWDVAAGQPIGELFHQEPHCVVFSPDGSRIITGGEDNVARLWETSTQKCLAEFRQFQDTVQDAVFSSDGSRFLIGSFDGTTRMWDAIRLEQVGEPLIHQSEVKGLALSPDGMKILIGFADGTIRLYDAVTHEPIGTPLQHVKLVSSVAYSPDGSQLLAGCIDGTARIWDAATLKPIGPPLEHNCGWPSASFSSDGSQILLFGQGRAQVWQALRKPLAGDSEQIVCWVQVITGMELDATGGITVLNAAAWNQRRQYLEKLGGPPITSTADFARQNPMKGL